MDSGGSGGMDWGWGWGHRLRSLRVWTVREVWGNGTGGGRKRAWTMGSGQALRGWTGEDLGLGLKGMLGGGSGGIWTE